MMMMIADPGIENYPEWDKEPAGWSFPRVKSYGQDCNQVGCALGKHKMINYATQPFKDTPKAFQCWNFICL